jgi:hypothetical protein
MPGCPKSKIKLTLNIVNLALAFAQAGCRSGVLDTDIFGPSIPKLLNLSGEPGLTESMRLATTNTWYMRATNTVQVANWSLYRTMASSQCRLDISLVRMRRLCGVG